MFVVFSAEFGALSHGVCFLEIFRNSRVCSFLYLSFFASLWTLFLLQESVFSAGGGGAGMCYQGVVAMCSSSACGDFLFFLAMTIQVPLRCAVLTWCLGRGVGAAHPAGGGARGESRVSWTTYQLVPAMLSSGLLPAASSVISGFWVSRSCSHLCDWLFLHVIWVVVFPINMILSLFLTSGSPQNFCPSVPPILVFKHCCEFISFKDRFSGIFRNLRWE